MVAPKVEHKKREQVETYDEVTRSCPAGYEGHFVDTRTGFDFTQYWLNGWGGYEWRKDGSGEAGYTICFKKEFMDEIRKNPELITNRPPPPKPI